jgi:hypothetical protein
MNLALNYDEISFINIFFYDPIKNTVMNDSSFIRIIYSNKDFILNGIYIKFLINKDLYNTNKNNIDILKNIEILEKHILTIYNSDKQHSYKIKDQLFYLIHKLNMSNNDEFNYILKISGIWETHDCIGLTYKFIFI